MVATGAIAGLLAILLLFAILRLMTGHGLPSSLRPSADLIYLGPSESEGLVVGHTKEDLIAYRNASPTTYSSVDGDPRLQSPTERMNTQFGSEGDAARQMQMELSGSVFKLEPRSRATVIAKDGRWAHVRIESGAHAGQEAWTTTDNLCTRDDTSASRLLRSSSSQHGY